MRFLRHLGRLLKEILGFAWHHKAWWIVPVVLIMLVLALIIVLDQFTRNVFRDSARAFAGDAQALQAALVLLESAAFAQLEPLQRWFVLMPLEHAEDLAMQQRCVAEFEALTALDARLAGALDYARRHLQVIERFGRFPHRNQVLGRPSTAQELSYLAQPGSGF